jgi:hypothetical protein
LTFLTKPTNSGDSFTAVAKEMGEGGWTTSWGNIVIDKSGQQWIFITNNFTKEGWMATVSVTHKSWKVEKC